MRRMKYYARVYRSFLRLGFLRITQYPLDSMISLFSIIAREAVGFLGVFAIANAVGALGGLSIYGITLIYSLGAMTEAFSRGLFDNVWSVSSYIRKGVMDIALIRPAGVFFQLIGGRMQFESIISFIVPFSLMMMSLVKLGITCSVGRVLFLLEFMVFGVVLNSSLYLIFNCVNFWLVQGNEIADLAQTFREFAKYPIHIFPVVLQALFTYVLPFGFIGYYPAMYLLGKTEMCVPVVMPLVTAVVVCAAGLIWRAGMKTYDSTGT